MFENYGHVHVYSPRAGADNPLGTDFLININILSIYPFPASFALQITFYQFSPFKCMGDLC